MMAFQPYFKTKQVSDNTLRHLHSVMRHAPHHVYESMLRDTFSSWYRKSHFEKFSYPDFYETYFIILYTVLCIIC